MEPKSSPLILASTVNDLSGSHEPVSHAQTMEMFLMFNRLTRNSLAIATAMALSGGAHAFVVNETFAGNWGEGQGNRGLIIDILPTSSSRPANDFSNDALVQWFTYRDGEPVWLISNRAEIDKNSNSAQMTFFEFAGGTFGPAPDIGNPTSSTWGTGTLTFTSCSTATLDFDGIDGVGTLNVTPAGGAVNPQCVIDEEFQACPDFATSAGVPGTCIVGGPVQGDLTLTNETTWLIQGQLTVENGGTLTIEPGTELIGGTLGDTDTLIVRQGGKIYAEGTATNPIIMRGPTATGRAEWGGVVINGFAPINGCAQGVDPCTAQGEGNSGTYGGNNPNDSSGIFKYVVVSNAGRQFSEENELNGIAFQGVGDGTTVEYIQVHLNEDDGVEFFGGTVNAKYLVLTGIGDDSLDWTQGWQGKVQYVIAKQYTDDGDQGIEADNNGDANDSLPRALPMLANMTFIGQSNTDIGWLLREGTGARIANSVVTGFGEYCVDIDQQSTFDNVANLAAVNSVAGGCALGTFDDAGGDPFLVSDWFLDQGGNVDADPLLDNYVPQAGSPALNIGMVPFNDAFFSNVSYAGAVRDAQADWTAGWTVGLDRNSP